MKLDKKMFMFGASMLSAIGLSFITFLMLTNNIAPVITNNNIPEPKKEVMTWKPLYLPVLSWTSLTDDNTSAIVGCYVENLSADHSYNLTTDAADGHFSIATYPMYWANGTNAGGTIGTDVPISTSPYNLGFGILVRWSQTHAWNFANGTWDFGKIRCYANCSATYVSPSISAVNCTVFNLGTGRAAGGGTSYPKYVFVYYSVNNSAIGYDFTASPGGTSGGNVVFDVNYLA